MPLVVPITINGMQIEQIHPNFVQKLWPVVGPMLERALVHSGGEYSAEHLRMMLVRHEQVLLVAHPVGLDQSLEQVVLVAHQLVVVQLVVAGRMLAQQEVFEQLKEWCRLNGCTKIRGAANEAVARLWKQRFDMKERYRIVEAEL